MPTLTHPLRASHLALKPAAVTQAQAVATRYPTTRFERCLLIGVIIFMPLQDQIPSLPGFSFVYLLFTLMALSTLLKRPQVLARMWLHPLHLAGYTFIAVILVIEYSHPEATLYEIERIAMMIVGAVFISCLLRDRHALRVCIYTYLVTGLLLAVLLFLTAYGALYSARATDFTEATQVRGQALAAGAGGGLNTSGNTMAFYIAQSAAAALALALAEKRSRRRKLFIGLSLICLVGAFLPMSRGGIVIVVVSCGAVLVAHGVRHISTIIAAFFLTAAVLIWVPQAIFARFTFTPQEYTGTGKLEARARVYFAAFKYLPDYAVAGVGSGHFWGRWGQRSDFNQGDKILGAHNGPFQAIIYWGFPGLLALVMLLYQAYRCLPPQPGHDALLLALYGISVTLLLFLQVHHVLYSKQFSVGLGLLAGASVWIWPRRMIRSTQSEQRYNQSALLSR
jgi:hypothetical protein